jgi:hypothetical protein
MERNSPGALRQARYEGASGASDHHDHATISSCPPRAYITRGCSLTAVLRPYALGGDSSLSARCEVCGGCGSANTICQSAHANPPGNPANDGALIEVGEAMEPRLALSRRGQTEK